MKRILFYYDNFCGPESKGGTEVATHRIAHALALTGEWEVFNAFRNKQKKMSGSVEPYTNIIKLGHSGNSFINSLAEFINKNEIDVVVNMSRFYRHSLICKATQKSEREVKIVFMQHFAPGSESKKSTYKAGMHLLKLNPGNPLYWIRTSLYPLFKLPRKLKLKKTYREVYERSHRVVVLSKGYINQYAEIASLNDNRKLVSIPNIFDKDDITISSGKKEKRVLILSRMDEVQKRISLALEIWKKVESNPSLQDWQLDIVGTGHDLGAIKRKAGRLNLKRVIFHGWKKPDEFLKKASVLMMTSEYEGLPLSLLEARAYGCIPVAFDSFASLRDVLEDGVNGVIIKEFGDTERFASRLVDLLLDEDKRDFLIRNTRQDTEKFSSATVAFQWTEMLNELDSTGID